MSAALFALGCAPLPAAVLLLASLIAGRAIALVLHEASHACAASLCGYRCRLRVDVINQRGWCHVPGIGGTWAGRIVSATGWLTSVVLAAAAARVYVLAVEPSSSLLGAALGAAWTAAEAVCSDLLGFAGGASDAFHCGNFGLILLHNACRHKVLPILRSMMTVTMMRGAQSAGVVTYWSDRGRRIGKRRRVVNGKRTDLATLLLGPEHGISRLWRSPAIEPAPAIYQGHTRFATSSRATIDGCHPHQWSPLAWCRYWRLDSSAAGGYKSVLAPVEAYVTHNGDLDFFRLGDDVDYPLEELQVLLPKLLDAPLPTTADSACIAGLVDLLRTRGLWAASVRYGLLFGALAGSGSLARLPDWFARAVIEQLASIFEAEFVRVLADYDHAYGEGIPTPPPSPPIDSSRSSSCDKPQVPPIDVSSWWNPFGTKRNTADSLGVSSLGVSLEEGGGSKRGDSKRADSVRGDSKHGDSIDGDSKQGQSSKRGDSKRSSSAYDADLKPPTSPLHQARLARELRKAILARLPELSRLIDIDRMHRSLGGQPLSPEKMQERVDHFVSATIGAFFLNDLLSTGREVLARASGSFGLVLSHSLDAERELVVAARGQTMSVAFYPQLGLVLFGSEAAALKAGLSELALDESSKTGEAFNRRTGELKGAFRLDLDDLGGEVVLLAWGTEKPLLTVPYEASERAHVHAAAQGKDTHDPGSPGGLTRDDSKESTSSFKPLREDSYTKQTSEKQEVVEGIVRYVHDGKQRACGIVHYTEARQRVRPFIQRAIRLEGNSLILPLPPLAAPDPVGRDLRDIPGVLRMLQRDFADHQVSLNVPTAWTFASRVRRRLRRYEQGEADGSVDVLITGCEASLWVGEPALHAFAHHGALSPQVRGEPVGRRAVRIRSRACLSEAQDRHSLGQQAARAARATLSDPTRGLPVPRQGVLVPRVDRAAPLALRRHLPSPLRVPPPQECHHRNVHRGLGVGHADRARRARSERAQEPRGRGREGRLRLVHILDVCGRAHERGVLYFGGGDAFAPLTRAPLHNELPRRHDAREPCARGGARAPRLPSRPPARH